MQASQKRKFITNIVYYTILAVLLYGGVRFVLPILLPFLIAFLVAWILNRPSYYFAKKMHISPKPVSIILVALFYCVVGFLFLSFGASAFRGIRNLVFQIPNFYTNEMLPLLDVFFARIEELISHADAALLPSIDNSVDQLTQFISGLPVKAVGWVSGYASGLPFTFIRVIITIISTFFFAADFRKVTVFIYQLMPARAQDLTVRAKEYVVGALFIYIRSYALIMSITFAELCLGFLIMRIPYAVPIAFIIAIFDILPILGVGGILVPWAVFAGLFGYYPLAIGLLLLYLVIVVIRNIIEPRIVGKQIGLHPLATLISMFVGAQLLGIIGLFVMPITLSLLLHLDRTGAIHIFHRKPAAQNDNDIAR